MSIREMRKQLKEAGLTENESKVYLALLELGQSNAGLISKKSGLHRRVVYDVLDRLIKKGIIGFIIMNGVRVFQASNPERIMEILKEKEANLLEILPSMNQLYSKTRESEGTNFFKGKRGFKTIFEDQINTGKEIFIIGASPLAYETIPFYFKWYDKRRIEKRIKTNIIFNKTKKKIKVPYSDIRYLPKKYESDVSINIYGDKVAILLWNKENPLAILIKNKLFVKGYRQYFDLLWSISKKE